MSRIKKKEARRWYYGTRGGEWYLAYPSDVPEYKRREGISQSEMRRIGRARAKKRVLAPTTLK